MTLTPTTPDSRSGLRPLASLSLSAFAFPGGVACGAAPGRGCAAAIQHRQPARPFPLFWQLDNVHQVTVMLLTFTSMSPVLVLFLGVSLRVPCPAARFAHRRLPRLRADFPPLNRRRGCPPVPPPGPLPPTFSTSNWVFSTPFGGSALTPHAAGCPNRHHLLSTTFDLPSTTISDDTNRHESLGPSVYCLHIRLIPLIYI